MLIEHAMYKWYNLYIKFKGGIHMKRDMDLIRKLLIKIEEVYEPGMVNINVKNVLIDGYDTNTIMEHLRLMDDAGLFQGIQAKQYVTGSTIVSIGNLTNKGYDTLEEFKNDTVWNQTKEIVAEKGLPLIIDVFKDVASAVIASITEGALKAIK